MPHNPKDIDIQGMEPRPYGLLLDAAQPLGVSDSRWALAGVTWVPWGCTMIDTDVVGCNVTNIKNLEDFATIETQRAFLMLDGIRCSTLSSEPDVMDERLRDRLTVYASKAFGVELMRGTNGGPNSFRADAQIINNTARSLRLAFSDLERHLADKLHGAKGAVHVPPAAMPLIAADGLAHFNNGSWETATGHDVISDAGYAGAAPNGVAAVAADVAFLYASGPVYVAITDIDEVGMRNHESTDMSRNVHEFFAERYGLVAYDPCAVGAVRTTLA